MTPFTRLSARAAVVNASDIDTDRIIPARFLKVTSKTGLGDVLFCDWPDFPRAAARGAGVLIAGNNFGCGSSREHAVWALMDFGFRAVIAPGFADIFRGNALKCGLLPVALPAGQIAALDPASVTVDLDQQTVESAGKAFAFTVEPFARRLLLAGQDELGYLLGFVSRVEAFERCA